jgi:hypothetical protein
VDNASDTPFSLITALKAEINFSRVSRSGAHG